MDSKAPTYRFCVDGETGIFQNRKPLPDHYLKHVRFRTQSANFDLPSSHT